MNEWWEGLTSVNRGFYCAAAFFGVLFLWQLIAAFVGLSGEDFDAEAGGDADVDADAGDTYDSFEHGADVDAVESTVAFNLFSFRSIVTFFTLFTLGTAMYLNNGLALAKATGLGTVWGLVGMLAVASVFYLMMKLSHSGTMRLASCIGTEGTVYLDIPENGVGEVKVIVTGSSQHVKARVKDGVALSANTQVKVLRQIDQGTIEVSKVEQEIKEGE